MKKLSTGSDSTLGEYKKLAILVFGEKSKAVVYLDNAINESKNGEDEEVIADENQMIFMLSQLHLS